MDDQEVLVQIAGAIGVPVKPDIDLFFEVLDAVGDDFVTDGLCLALLSRAIEVPVPDLQRVIVALYSWDEGPEEVDDAVSEEG